LKNRLGEDIAYEVMSYVALDPGYLTAVTEQGYKETAERLGINTEVDEKVIIRKTELFTQPK